MKSVMLSIRPKWCEKIIQGQKTIEVRRTQPKLQTPFKVVIYCTKGGKTLNIPISQERLIADIAVNGMKSMNCPIGNGSVIGEFVCDTMIVDKTCGRDAMVNGAACIDENDAVEYAQGKLLYGWHISDLKIYDQPRSLTQFGCRSAWTGMNKAPQSWCYAEEIWT